MKEKPRRRIPVMLLSAACSQSRPRRAARCTPQLCKDMLMCEKCISCGRDRSILAWALRSIKVFAAEAGRRVAAEGANGSVSVCFQSAPVGDEGNVCAWKDYAPGVLSKPVSGISGQQKYMAAGARRLGSGTPGLIPLLSAASFGRWTTRFTGVGGGGSPRLNSRHPAASCKSGA